MSKAQRCAFHLLSHLESTSRPGLPLLQPDNHGQPHERRVFFHGDNYRFWLEQPPVAPLFSVCLVSLLSIPNDVGGVWTPMVGKQADKPLTDRSNRSTVGLANLTVQKRGSGSELTGVVRADLTARQSKHLWPMANVQPLRSEVGDPKCLSLWCKRNLYKKIDAYTPCHTLMPHHQDPSSGVAGRGQGQIKVCGNVRDPKLSKPSKKSLKFWKSKSPSPPRRKFIMYTQRNQ